MLFVETTSNISKTPKTPPFFHGYFLSQDDQWKGLHYNGVTGRPILIKVLVPTILFDSVQFHDTLRHLFHISV